MAWLLHSAIPEDRAAAISWPTDSARSRTTSSSTASITIPISSTSSTVQATSCALRPTRSPSSACKQATSARSLATLPVRFCRRASSPARIRSTAISGNIFVTRISMRSTGMQVPMRWFLPITRINSERRSGCLSGKTSSSTLAIWNSIVSRSAIRLRSMSLQPLSARETFRNC